jgi:cell division protein FtsA
MRNDLIIGLDIGSSFVRAIAGKQNDRGRLEILATGTAGNSNNVLNGEIVNINKTTAAISEAMNQISHVLDGKNSEHFFASNLSGSHIKVQPFTLSKTRKNEREPVSSQEVMSLFEEAKRTFADKNPCVLHTLPIGFKVGNLPDTLDPIGQIGQKIQADFVFISANPSKNDLLTQCLKSAETKHLKKGNVYFSSLATASAVLSAEEKQEGVVKHAVVLNWGGDLITEDIQSGLEISRDHAENLKVRFGSAIQKDIPINEVVMIPGISGRKATPVSVKNLAIIIEERLKELAAIIVAEISKQTDCRQLKAGIVITGGGAQLPYIDEFFQKFTGLDARIGDPNATSANPAIATEIKDPSFATVIGLVQVYYDQQETADVDDTKMESSPVKDMSKETGFTDPQPPKPAPRIGDLFRKMVDVVMGDDDGGNASY